ncbi:MAG: hypothetical protein ACLP9K_10080 [Nitrososphaerales archaeon]|jgi:hypothetical protein
MTAWKELEPFHHDITKSIFEVLIENCFHPGSFKKSNEMGFFAPLRYWQKRERNPRGFPLVEPVRFLSELLKKPSFVSSVRAFNAAASTDWLAGPNLVELGPFVYTICFYLAPVLRFSDSAGCVKPKFTRFVS